MKNPVFTTKAKEFLQNTNTTLDIEFLKYDYHFNDDKEKRNIYKCTLKRGSRSYTFSFWDSVYNTQKNTFSSRTKLVIKNGFDNKKNCKEEIIRAEKEIKNSLPSEYDILTCLDVFEGDFKDFCDCFWYDEDSKKAEKIYNAVIEQNNWLKMLFTDAEIEKLQEIQ